MFGQTRIGTTCRLQRSFFPRVLALLINFITLFLRDPLSPYCCTVYLTVYYVLTEVPQPGPDPSVCVVQLMNLRLTLFSVSCSSVSRPAQKLISELICEAHVSLQRCSLDSGSSLIATQSNTKTTTNRDAGHTDCASSPARKRQTLETPRTSKSDDLSPDSGSSPVRRNSSGEEVERICPSETTKLQKRPARLPLPALALFLKQHSAKHKKSNSKLNSPPQAPPPESKVFATESCRPDPEQTAPRASSPLNPAASEPESLSSEPGVFQDKTEGSFCSLTFSTSAEPSRLSPPLPAVLSHPNATKTLGDAPAGTSSLPSDPVKTDSLLFDPECSSFCFEPLSPASSPEPLPPLPESLSLEIGSSSSVAVDTAESTPDLDRGKPSSVFKWHTVLPPTDTYVDSFTTCHPPQQDPPFKSVTPPPLPCLNTSTDESTLTFHDAEVPLPFPAELSPLTLQLSLSPTFSSLDENGLSPAPSLSDLVHFFSTNVDVGIGGEFSDGEAAPAPCPPPSVAETPAPAPPPQLQPAPRRKPGRRKKSKSSKLSRLDTNQNMDDYRSLQPNLEEVEEQLFVSFASKVNLIRVRFKLYIWTSFPSFLRKVTEFFTSSHC